MEGVIVVLLVIIAVMVFAGPRFGAVRSDQRGYRSGGGSGWLVGLLPFLGSDDRDERDGGGDGGYVMNASGSPDDRDQNDRDDDASDDGGDDGGDSDGGDSD